jgi:hypothetical protein
MNRIELRGNTLSDWKKYMSEHQIFQCPDLEVLLETPQRFWARALVHVGESIDFTDPSIQAHGDPYWFIDEIMDGMEKGVSVMYSTNINLETDPHFPRINTWHKVNGMLFYSSYICGHNDFYILKHIVHNITATGIAFFFKREVYPDLPKVLSINQIISSSTHILYEAFDGDGYVCGKLINQPVSL